MIVVPTGRRAGVAVVIDPGLSLGEDPRPFVLTIDRQVRRLGTVDFPVPPQVLDRVRIPRSFSPRSANSRRELAALLRTRTDGMEIARPGRRARAHDEDAELAQLRAQMRAHPCHGCSDREQHARWAERAHRLRTETAGLQRRLEGRTNSIARQFDRICEVLMELGYLTGPVDTPTVTEAGTQLSRIYGESDLLAMQCLRQGLWDSLSPPELAAACSALVYESRGSCGAGGSAAARACGHRRDAGRDDADLGDPRGARAPPWAAAPPGSRTSGSPGRSTGGPRVARCAPSWTARS